MLMSDRTISYFAEHGAIEPYAREHLQPASYDLTLSNVFTRYSINAGTAHRSEYGPHVDPNTRTYSGVDAFSSVYDGPFIMYPGEFMLGSTNEIIRMPSDFGGRFEGKSTLGRFGLATHITAGFVDPGFEGTLTLEMKNNNTVPILITPGMFIGQICFYALEQPCEHPYGSSEAGSHYQGQHGPTPPKQ